MNKLTKVLLVLLLTFGQITLLYIQEVKAVTYFTDYAWTKMISGPSFNDGYAIDMDASGNLYITGRSWDSFNYAADWGGSDTRSYGYGFVTKINSDGSYGWSRTTSLITMADLKVDSNGDIYVAGGGSLSSTNVAVDFGTTDTKSTQFSPTGAIVMKINSDGSYGWTKMIDSTRPDTAIALEIDSNDNVFVVGTHQSTNMNAAADWGGTDTKTNYSGFNVAGGFLTKINSDGSYGWTKTFGGPGSLTPEALAVDSSDNILVGGTFGGTVNFQADWGGTSNKSSSGAYDGFVMKVNSDSSFGFVRKIGSTGYDYVQDIHFDASDNYYVSGIAASTANLAADWGGTDSKSGVFLFKINSGETYAWGTNSVGVYGTGVKAPEISLYNNQVYVASGYYQGYISNFTDTGTKLWEHVFGANDLETVHGVVVDSTGIYLVGEFGQTVNFAADWGGTDNKTGLGTGTQGIFVTKLFHTLATQITNLAGGLKVEDVATASDATQPNTEFPVTPTREILLSNASDYPIAAVDVDMTSTDRDWSAVTGDIDLAGGKAFAHNITSAPGTASDFTLYVPIPSGKNSESVVVCPGASSLGAVEVACSGAVSYSESDPEASKTKIGGQDYWVVTGLTGTGGISIFDSFQLKDTLTRLEVSTASDHTLEFGSVNATDTSGDTIAIQFDPSGQAWDLTGLTVADIDLEDDGVDKTLAAAPGADIWGVTINTGTDTITFTAPTSGTDYIATGSVLHVKIGETADGGSNQMVNPGTVSSYEIGITISNSSGTETGEVEIPIIDDDTVNVTGFIDTFITFDIDTASSNVQCDAAGGVNPCDSHSGISDNVGYVVDLGEMNTSTVNDSGDFVAHATGSSGAINYIYFDLSSNANGGVVVTAQSLNNELSGSGANAIPMVADGSEVQITAGSGLYGINSYAFLQNSALSGAAIKHVDCDGTSGINYYCDVPTTPTEIFNTGGLPIDTLRMQWEVAASPDALDGTGTYTDQLTFVATATF